MATASGHNSLLKPVARTVERRRAYSVVAVFVEHQEEDLARLRGRAALEETIVLRRNCRPRKTSRQFGTLSCTTVLDVSRSARLRRRVSTHLVLQALTLRGPRRTIGSEVSKTFIAGLPAAAERRDGVGLSHDRRALVHWWRSDRA